MRNRLLSILALSICLSSSAALLPAQGTTAAAPAATLGPAPIVKLGDSLPAAASAAITAQHAPFATHEGPLVLYVIPSHGAGTLPTLRLFNQVVITPLKNQVMVLAIDTTELKEKNWVPNEENIPVINDSTKTILHTLIPHTGKNVIPRVLVLDKEKKIRVFREGFQQGRIGEVRAAVEAILKGEEVPDAITLATARPDSVPQATQALRNKRPSPQLHAISIKGDKAPEIPVETWINPMPEDTTGKYVLVDFWATWCGPCIVALDEGEKLHGKFSDKLVTMAISDEPAMKVATYVAKKKWKQPIGVDTKARTKDLLKVRAIPHAYLVNPEGTVVWQGHPGGLWANEGQLLGQYLSGEKIE